MCSLPSANGPSVMSTSPRCTRTTVAVLGGCSPPVNTQTPAALASFDDRVDVAHHPRRTSGGGGSPSGW